MTKVLPVRVCPKCGDEFTPIPRRNRTLPEACKGCIRSVNWHQQRARFTEALQQAGAAKKRRARERLAEQLAQEFGTISDREARVFSAGVAAGYTRGYNAAYRVARRA